MIITPIIKSFLKITILTLIFFVIIYLGISIINAWWWNDDKDNSNNFKSIDNYGLNEVGVALNINVGTKFYENKSNNYESYYNDIVPISIIRSDKNKTNNVLITKNIEALKDYINITKIDVKGYLDSGGKRKDNYDSLMTQLKVRYKTGYANAKNLGTQIESITIHIDNLNKSIDNTKESMVLNLKNYNSLGLNKNINDYISIKNEITTMKIYAIFCSRFLSYYNLLNNYTKEIITVLKLNEDAIIKNTYVVIPENGNDLIQKLNLIYNESDISTKQDNNGTKSSSDLNNLNYDNNNTNIDSTINFDTDYSISNNNVNGIFGDPFNLNNGSLETIKQSGKIDFGATKYINNN